MKKIKIIYDGECPFCQEYVNYVKLREKYTIELVDVRLKSLIVNELNKEGFDINDGMILKLDEQIYQGAQAAVKINELIRYNNIFEKIFFFIVKDNILFKLIYKLVLFFRFIVLKLMGRDVKI